MNRPHPLWLAIPVLSVGIVTGLLLTLNYANGWDSQKDIITLMTVMAGSLAGSEVVRRRAGTGDGDQPVEPEQEPE